MAVVKVTALYIAGMIGAGLASGRELVQFFTLFGKGGMLGVIFSIIILTLGTGAFMNIFHERKITSYAMIFKDLPPMVGKFMDFIYSLFLLVSVSIMLAGSGHTFASSGWETGITIITAIFVGIVIIKGVDEMLTVSTLLVPLLVIAMVVIACKQLLNEGFAWPHEGQFVHAGAGVLYASYNLSYALAALSGVHQVLRSSRERWCAAILGNGILGFLLWILIMAINTLPDHGTNFTLPLLHIAEGWSKNAGIFYAVVLWLSMYTTAIANCFALVNRIKMQSSLSWSTSTILVLSLSLIFSQIGFTNLIKVAYPLLGFAGMYLLFTIWKR